MSIRHLFLTLLGLQTLMIVIWYFAFYSPQNKELHELEDNVNLTFAKLKSAKKAQLDLNSIQQRLTEEQLDLENVRSRFLKKNQLEKATAQLEKMARQHDLKLTEFSPILENYLASSEQNQEIRGYPLVITVEGRYINIGKFIDNWERLPFYMTPEEIKLKRKEEGSNELQAMVSGILYAFTQ